MMADNNDVLRALGRIEGTLTSFIVSNNLRLEHIEKDVKDNQDSITDIKVKAGRWAGGAAVVGMIGGYLLKFIPFLPRG